MAGDSLEFDGEVVDSNKGKFTIKVNDSYSVLCTLAGELRKNAIKVLLGDKVKIEVSPYDVSRGRVRYRFKV